MENCDTCKFKPDWRELFDLFGQAYVGDCRCQDGETIFKDGSGFYCDGSGDCPVELIDCEKWKPKKTKIPETSAEEWAQIFLKDHCTGDVLFKRYEKWCQENNRPVINHTVFFLKIYQFFGAI